METVETVLLLRHARSTANVDPGVYAAMPDHTIPLASPLDDADALAAGVRVAALGMDPHSTCSWTSTFLRCRQTEELVVRRAFGDAASSVTRRESFLLRERDYGDWDGWTDAQIAERDPTRFARRARAADPTGSFHFRCPNGESRADVVQRLALFIARLERTPARHHVVFLHGITQRAFRMAWFDRTVEWFEHEPNPANASVLQLTRGPDGTWDERYLVDPTVSAPTT